MRLLWAITIVILPVAQNGVALSNQPAAIDSPNLSYMQDDGTRHVIHGVHTVLHGSTSSMMLNEGDINMRALVGS